MANNKRQIVYGLHAVRHCLINSPEAVLEVWVHREKKDHHDLSEIIKLLRSHSITIQVVSVSTLEDKAHTSQHQGIVLSRKPYPVLSESDLQDFIQQNQAKKKLFLILDNIQDPHNLGACFRSADSVGIDGIIVSKDRSVTLTSTVCKVASGAVETVSFYSVTNLARTIRTLKDNNIWVYGLDGAAEQTLYQTDLTSSTAIVMGSEGDGLRENTKKQCDQLIQIPMHGSIESLNVSVATAVSLYEALRQRQL